jgi:hypothetical protein
MNTEPIKAGERTHTYGQAVELERQGLYAEAAVAYKSAGDCAGGHTHAANCYFAADRCEALAITAKPAEPQTKHTPGPWVVSNTMHGMFIDAVGVGSSDFRSGKGVAEVTGSNRYNNARLISSAPDLLEALKAVQAEIACGCQMRKSAIRTIERAINKAEGRE